MIALICMIWNVVKTIIFGNPTPGYTTLISAILFLGSIQLISIGILGEYIGRLTQEVKGRPVYVVSELADITDNTLFEAKCNEIVKQLDIRKIKNTKEQ